MPNTWLKTLFLYIRLTFKPFKFSTETTEKLKEKRDQDLASTDQSQDYRDNDNENQQEESSYRAKDIRDALDVVINFNELERSIYRTAGQGLAF